MHAWYAPALAVALLFAIHNLFVQRAAGRVPDVWGAFVLEAVAAVVILLAIGMLALTGHAPPAPRDTYGVALAAAAGVFIGAGSVLYFWVFRLGAPLSVAVPLVLTGWTVVAVLLGVVLEGERLAWRQLAGLACALLGIWFLR